MATSEKDRFGDKLRDAGRAREDQYYAEQDRKLVEQLRRAKEGETEAALKEAAHMRCPKCGVRLEARRQGEVSFDECPACHGTWFDQSQLREFRRREREEEGWIARWLRAEFPHR